jgi:hypothetical protein
MGEPEDLEFRFVNGRVQRRACLCLKVNSTAKARCWPRRVETEPMSRLRDFGLDFAYYFGFGEGSDRVRESALDDESWLPVALGAVLVPVLGLVLHGPLGFDDDFVGRLMSVGFVAVLAFACGLLMRVAGRWHR